MSRDISLRPVESADREFLFQVYADTRREEMQLVPWSDDQRELFLRQQFGAQHAFYQQQFPLAAYQIVLAGGEPVGRLYVDRNEAEIRIIDIALLTAHRGHGMGEQILQDLLAESAEVNKPIRIHVARNNRAVHLYERLGFFQTGDTGVHYLMECTPRLNSDES